jgi:hypothetical protein
MKKLTLNKAINCMFLLIISLYLISCSVKKPETQEKDLTLDDLKGMPTQRIIH